MMVLSFETASLNRAVCLNIGIQAIVFLGCEAILSVGELRKCCSICIFTWQKEKS